MYLAKALQGVQETFKANLQATLNFIEFTSGCSITPYFTPSFQSLEAGAD